MNKIYIDIETKPEDEEVLNRIKPDFKAPSNYKDAAKIAAAIEEKESEWRSKAALSPLTGCVAAVGIQLGHEGDPILLHGDDEKGILEQTWGYITDHRAYTEPVLGWNIAGFDLPFLLKRSWKLGVKVPPSTITFSNGRASLNRTFIDLMTFWQCGNYSEKFTSLNKALAFFGLASKVDLGGELYYQTYARCPELALKYLARDITALRDLENILNVASLDTSKQSFSGS